MQNEIKSVLTHTQEEINRVSSQHAKDETDINLCVNNIDPNQIIQL